MSVHEVNEWIPGLLCSHKPGDDLDADANYRAEWDAEPPERTFNVVGADAWASVEHEGAGEVHWGTEEYPEEPLTPYEAEALGHALIAAAHFAKKQEAE